MPGLPAAQGRWIKGAREKSTIKPDSAPATPLTHTRLPWLHVAVLTADISRYRHQPSPEAPRPRPRSRPAAFPLTFRRRLTSPAPLRGSSRSAAAPAPRPAAGGGGREGGWERRCDARRGKWLKSRGRAGGGAGRARSRAQPLCSLAGGGRSGHGPVAAGGGSRQGAVVAALRGGWRGGPTCPR